MMSLEDAKYISSSQFPNASPQSSPTHQSSPETKAPCSIASDSSTVVAESQQGSDDDKASPSEPPKDDQTIDSPICPVRADRLLELEIQYVNGWNAICNWLRIESSDTSDIFTSEPLLIQLTKRARAAGKTRDWPCHTKELLSDTIRARKDLPQFWEEDPSSRDVRCLEWIKVLHSSLAE